MRGPGGGLLIGGGSPFPGPWISTTPSRLAILKEQADAMEAALDAVPEEQREIVRLRLHEQETMEEIARELGLGVSAVRHRFRKGLETYQRALRSEFTSRSLGEPPGQGSGSRRR